MKIKHLWTRVFRRLGLLLLYSELLWSLLFFFTLASSQVVYNFQYGIALEQC